MKTFFLSGQKSFGNRGCEALTRSTAKILRAEFQGANIIVPSEHADLDRRQWPDHEDFGVSFVPAFDPKLAKAWKIVQAAPLPFVLSRTWPFPVPRSHRRLIEQADAVLAIGGDNYSLDYFSIPSALMVQDEIGLSTGRPVVLWGASLGPFTVPQRISDAMRRHLERLTMLTIRETLSLSFVESLGLKHAHLVADAAFQLDDEVFDISSFMPERGSQGVIGLNMSPLAAKRRYRTEESPDPASEIASFIRTLVKRGYAVLLVPHVIPLDGSPANNDATYMRDQILSRLADINHSVTMAPDHLNAAQLKYVISQCSYFIGARTHSTIAAISRNIPTISISYSQKARGLNLDLFGHTEYTLASSAVSEQNLLKKFDKLVSDEAEIREILALKLPEWKKRAQSGAQLLKNLL